VRFSACILTYEVTSSCVHAVGESYVYVYSLPDRPRSVCMPQRSRRQRRTNHFGMLHALHACAIDML